MDKPFIRVSANDKYDRMVGIQITERRFKIFYPGKKEPNITYNGQETTIREHQGKEIVPSVTSFSAIPP